MTTIDWAALAVVAVSALLGFRRGLIASGLSLAGVLLGAWIGARIAPHLLSGGSRSPYTPLAALIGATIGAAVLQSVAVLLGTLARAVHGLGRLATHTGRWTTAWLGVGAAVLVNNLPAASVLSAQAPAHPRALLLGLDLGPNLAVSGSLSAVLWLQVARAAGAKPSIVRYSLLGLALVPLSLTLALFAATRF